MTDDTTKPNEQTTEPKVEQKSSDKKWKILVGILAVLLILCGTWILWGGVPFFPAAAPNDGGSSSQGGGLMIDPNAGEYVKPVVPGVTIPGFGEMTIPANTKELIGINLHNPSKNEGWYYLTFKLCLLDKNGEVSEVLYESQLLPPGLYIQDITLSRGLAKGTYEAVMQVQPYRIADNTPTNNADMRVTIVAK